MPRGSRSYENVHFDYREKTHDTTPPQPSPSSSSTIKSVGSARSNQTTAEYHIGSSTQQSGGLHNDREYSNLPFLDSSKNLILSKFFNSNNENNSAYENLCSGCGYGVFEARGKLCNFCQYLLNGGYPEDNSNIYENICDKCSELFSGDECLACSQANKHKTTTPQPDNAKSTSKKLKKRLIHSLLGSLKRVKSFNHTPSVSPHNANSLKPSNRKLQIVHNVDGFENVFRTNETFDLSRICELKQQLKASTSDHHIYGKLRKSDLSHKRYECIKQKSQSDDYLISGTGCEPLLFHSTSINSHDSFDDNNSSSYLKIQNSVNEWMTSLRCETHEYYSFGAPDTVLSNPKSIPANFTDFVVGGASSFVFSPRHVVYSSYDQMHDQSANASAELRQSSDEDFAQQMVNEFKRNLMEKPSGSAYSSTANQHLKARRQGIYLRLDSIESKQRDNYQQVDDQVVGDRQQRNDNNCLLQQQTATAQAQAVSIDLAAGLNGSLLKAEHQSNKRCCIYEKDSDFVSDILQAFDSFLLRESEKSLSLPLSSVQEERVVNSSEDRQVVNGNLLDIVSQSTTSGVIVELSLPRNIDLDEIVRQLVLSISLNKIVLSLYDVPLKVFLSGVDRSARLSHLKFSTLKKTFRRYQVFVSKQKLSDCSSTRSLRNKEIPAIECVPVLEQGVSRTRSPEVDSSPNSSVMTVPNGTSHTKAAKEEVEEEEEPIYQPIWKFKTVGQVQETDITDVYYDDHHRDHLPRRCDSSNSLAAAAAGASFIEDHDEWEPDDEFTFTTKLEGGCANKEPDTLSVNTIQSSSGSTITGYASSISTTTIASTSSASVSVSVTHHIFRNICIFYSPKDPKIRAVLYEYDRNRCSSYFAHQPTLPSLSIKETGCGGGDVNSSTAITAATSSADCYSYSSSRQTSGGGGGGNGNKLLLKKPSESGSRILADSVQAWKYLLLDVNYLEDEEDMIVSESQILKAQTIKEMESTPPTIGVLQRFKSISSGNLLDVPAEEDKKSITERVRNKLQRGVFKLHPRSPKENKKGRNLFRRNEATSLYLEDGMKPKYPIFKAPLEFLEMNETSYPDVPRFVVDCIEYIEQKDCIQMDGLYRASGNKVAIDELKLKLTESYIYDPKLLVTEDIHTLTSLLKMFFRELGSPLIPHDTYQKLAATKNLMEPTAIENMKRAFKEMKNPNRDTLKFLIKHLTTVAHYSSDNRMPASNLAIVWGPCILSANQIEFDIARMNTIAKVLIENYDRIFGDNERLVS